MSAKNQDKNRQSPNGLHASWIAIAAGVGTAIGAGVGVAFDQIALGAGIGTALGAGVGTIAVVRAYAGR